MKKFFSVPSQSCGVNWAFLFLRLSVGYAFLHHGWGKIQNPMGWMGPEAAVPGIFQGLAAVAEFGGGLALILGMLTRLGALGMAFTMAVAVTMHVFVFHDPFVNSSGGSSFELPATYFLVALLFVIAGPGKFSLDQKIFGVCAARLAK